MTNLTLAPTIATLSLIALAVERAFALRRWWHRYQIRRQLSVLRGGRPRPVFTDEGDLVQRTPRPPVRSLRQSRDDHHAA